MARIPTREELAWVAGFYEGEGCFGAHGRYCRPLLSIGQADLEPIERVRAIFELGSISTYQRLAYKRMWTWRVSSFEHCQAVIAMLWPWLSERRRQQARNAFDRMRARGGKTYGQRPKSKPIPLAGRGKFLLEMEQNYSRMMEVTPRP